jgi:hypothetical protein
MALPSFLLYLFNRTNFKIAISSEDPNCLDFPDRPTFRTMSKGLNECLRNLSVDKNEEVEGSYEATKINQSKRSLWFWDSSLQITMRVGWYTSVTGKSESIIKTVRRSSLREYLQYTINLVISSNLVTHSRAPRTSRVLSNTSTILYYTLTSTSFPTCKHARA